jgi:2-keto-4-pentenoate hydratase/2-oxohepta-3-ene-1,7-dioic acid hydratase in catechol pathway
MEKPGLLDDSGTLRDLSAHIADLTPETIGAQQLARLAALDPRQLSVVSGNPRIGVPVKGIGKFLAIGLNYSDHAAESNMPIPAEPVVFTKAISCLTGPNDEVMLPRDSLKSDWEVELGVIMGRTARHVSEAQALDYVAGFTLVNDVSERSWQLERGPQWDKGKGFDTFGPVGPWLVTADEVGDPQDLALSLDLNGQRRQSGHTRTMIFTVRQLIAYLSRCITLYPGDLITTGTPPGVGMGVKPQPVFLRAGDTMRLRIDKLGEQQQHVVPWRDLGETVNG